MAVSYTYNVWVRDPSVFRDLAEKVLAVYRLKPTTEQGLKVELQTIKFGFLMICGPMDHIFRRMVSKIAKAFRNPIKCTRTCNHEF